MKGKYATYSITYEKYFWCDGYILGIIASDDVHCNSLITYANGISDYLEVDLIDLTKILSRLGFKYNYSIYYFQDLKQLDNVKDSIDSLLLIKKLSKKS